MEICVYVLSHICRWYTYLYDEIRVRVVVFIQQKHSFCMVIVAVVSIVNIQFGINSLLRFHFLILQSFIKKTLKKICLKLLFHHTFSAVPCSNEKNYMCPCITSQMILFVVPPSLNFLWIQALQKFYNYYLFKRAFSCIKKISEHF